MGAGQVRVRLPAGITSDVTARTHLGGMAILGEERSGSDAVATGHLAGCPERGRLLIDIKVRVGHVEVEGPGGRDATVVCDAPAPG